MSTIKEQLAQLDLRIKEVKAFNDGPTTSEVFGLVLQLSTLCRTLAEEQSRIINEHVGNYHANEC